MGLFSKVKTNRSISRLEEERLYEYALTEVEGGEIRKGIWAKALSQSKGDDAAAKALYLEMRVQSIIDEGRVADALMNAAMDSLTELEKKELKEAEEQKKRMAAKEKQRRVNQWIVLAVLVGIWYLISIAAS